MHKTVGLGIKRESWVDEGYILRSVQVRVMDVNRGDAWYCGNIFYFYNVRALADLWAISVNESAAEDVGISLNRDRAMKYVLEP